MNWSEHLLTTHRLTGDTQFEFSAPGLRPFTVIYDDETRRFYVPLELHRPDETSEQMFARLEPLQLIGTLPPC